MGLFTKYSKYQLLATFFGGWDGVNVAIRVTIWSVLYNVTLWIISQVLQDSFIVITWANNHIPALV